MKAARLIGPYIGTASWTIPRVASEAFPDTGSHLVRYAQQLNGVEINSSFYRLHKPATYARWAGTVPDHFRFSVKIPRTISHDMGLKDADLALEEFLVGARELKGKLGVLLLQLPPSLAFEAKVVSAFFKMFRGLHQGPLVCEPRHKSWFTIDAEATLSQFNAGRVAADPAIVPAAAKPGGMGDLVYYRLHGSPEIYRSAYSDRAVDELTKKLMTEGKKGKSCWCIYDNTALGAATLNALRMSAQIHDQ